MTCIPRTGRMERSQRSFDVHRRVFNITLRKLARATPQVRPITVKGFEKNPHGEGQLNFDLVSRDKIHPNTPLGAMKYIRALRGALLDLAGGYKEHTTTPPPPPPPPGKDTLLGPRGKGPLPRTRSVVRLIPPQGNNAVLGPRAEGPMSQLPRTRSVGRLIRPQGMFAVLGPRAKGPISRLPRTRSTPNISFDRLIARAKAVRE